MSGAPRAALRASLLGALLLLCGCPQEIRALEPDGGTAPADGGPAGPDAGLPPVVTCPTSGPSLSCAVDGPAALLPVESIVSVRCTLDGRGRAARYLEARVSPPALVGVQDRLGVDGTVLVQVQKRKLGLAFRDTQLAVDVLARHSDDERSCASARVTFTVAGNLWVTDPAAGVVRAFASDGTLLGDALPPMGEPRAIASLPDGVLIGGAQSPGGPTELVKLGFEGALLATFTRKLGAEDVLANRLPHSAVLSGDGFLYVSLGVGDQSGRLLKYAPDGQSVSEITLPAGRSPRGLAALPGGGLAVGLLNGNGAFLRLDAGGTNAREIVPAWRDSASTSDCKPNATFGVALLGTGGLWISARDPGSWGLAGLEATLKPGSFAFDRYSPHTHATSDKGALFNDPHDWLVELSSGVYVAGGFGSPVIDVLDPGSFGARSPPVTLGGYSGSPRGMVRLK